MAKEDIILERISIGNCSICNKALPLENKKVDYYGHEIRICKTHPAIGD